MCSDWDADLEEQDRKNQQLEDQKDKEEKTPETGPACSSVDTFTHKPSTSSTEQLDNQSCAPPEVKVQKFDTLATLLGHVNTL